jgi:DNA-binding transcriptional ArsR family regulator
MRAEQDDSSGQAGLAATPDPPHGFGLSDIRAANRACILATLAREGPLSRSALARRLGLSRTTVSAIVADLLREGLLHEAGMLPAAITGGRRAVLLLVGDGRAGGE